MSSWEDLLSLSDTTEAATSSDQLLVARRGQEAVEVIAYLQGWFGDSKDRDRVRLVVDDTDHGVLERAAAYQLVLPSDRGPLGAGDHASLPGHDVGFTPLSLCCPEPGCQVRAMVVSYEPDDRVHCVVHPDAVLRTCD